MATEWEKIISQFSGKKVLVVGDVVVDEYIHGVVERQNPEASTPLLKAQKENAMTGGAGNVAKNLAQLGAEATLIAVVGMDERAETLRQLAKKERYVPVLIADRSRPTIRKVRFYKGMDQLLRVDYEEAHDISFDIEDAVIAAIDKAVADAVEAIIVSDYAKGTITARVAKHILAVSKDKKILLAADVKPSRADLFVGADIISPNLKEAKQFLGLHQDTQDTPEQIAIALNKKMKAEVFLTLSANGIYYAGSDSHEYIKNYTVEESDPSGAGDTAITVIALARLLGVPPKEAAQLANAAGAVVVTKVGSVGLSQQELATMILDKNS